MCSATSRLFVAGQIADDFIAALVKKAGKLAVGGYDDPGAELGPWGLSAYQGIKHITQAA